ncbi:MAG: hypothetical protein P8Y12_12600 [Gammaproteobacteria bacterium]|jgi:hypothetical protein
MPDTPNNLVKKSDWLKLMLEGQLTRDSVLKTRTEIEEDNRRAEDLESKRRALFHHTKDSDQT